MVPLTAVTGSLFGSPASWSIDPAPGPVSKTVLEGGLPSPIRSDRIENGFSGSDSISSISGLALAGLSTNGPVSSGLISGSSISSIASGAPESQVKAPFADLLTQAIGQVDQLDSQARSTVEGLLSGSGVDVHQAMIATQKAERGFELVLSVRSKALAAYQQVVGMQF